MRNLTRAASLVLTAAALAACADQPTTPSARAAGPSLAVASACAASPTAVVGSEAELRAAVAAAQPGDVIAITGMIPLAAPVALPTPGITVTCAEPGAGLALTNRFLGMLLQVEAANVTISGLVLDAAQGYAAIAAFNVFGQDFSGIRVSGNRIACGHTTCVFFVGTRGTEVTDNHFQGDRTNTGVQFQAPGRLADGAERLVGQGFDLDLFHIDQADRVLLHDLADDGDAVEALVDVPGDAVAAEKHPPALGAPDDRGADGGALLEAAEPGFGILDFYHRVDGSGRQDLVMPEERNLFK